MTPADAYRVELRDALGLADFLTSLRRDAMRIFARLYGGILADEVARRVDGHKSGFAPGPPGGSPLRDAVRHLRVAQSAAPEGSPLRLVDLRLRLMPAGGSLLVEFEEGHADYRAALAEMDGVRQAGVRGPRPEGVGEDEWAERAALWDLARAGPPMGRGLTFRLVEDGLPIVRHAALKLRFPAHEVRCQRTARAIVEDRSGPGEAVRSEVEREVRRLTRILPREISEEDASSYPVPRPRPARAVAPARSADEIPQIIDHADVIEAADGRVFVAVPDAGLDPDERVHIQVVDRYLSFVQGATHFGGVPNAPYAAVELLRRSREVYVVELRKVEGRREIRARHVALVRDDSLPDAYKIAMSGFRTSAVRARRRANVQWME